jgi:excisionase family DNA binding protein
MALAGTNILTRSKHLAQSLRREGRVEDADVIDQLVQTVEQQAKRSEYATTGDVAKRLGVSRQTVVNWIKRGFLPGVKFGGRLVVPQSELQRVEELARLLDIVDAEQPLDTPEEIDGALQKERDQELGIEQTRLEQELARLDERLHRFEAEHQLPSAEFSRLFRAGELGDEADFFEWRAVYQMWLATRQQLDLVQLPAG